MAQRWHRPRLVGPRAGIALPSSPNPSAPTEIAQVPWRPDPALHENGQACPACALRREKINTAEILRPPVPCNRCGGTGRVGFSAEQIIEAAVAWARIHYWPAFDRRNGIGP